MLSTIPKTDTPIRVVVSPSQSSCFAGESLSVTITFTNTCSVKPGTQRNVHKRSAHSISAVPLARPPTSPRTPKTVVPVLPPRSASDGDVYGRKGLVGRGKSGITIQTSGLKKGRVPNRSLSLDVFAQNHEELVSSPLEAKTPLHVKRAFGNISTPSSPHVSSPLARSASLPLASNHPHARKMSILDATFTTHESPSPITPTMTSSASTSSYSLSLDPISESSQTPHTPFGVSPPPTGTVSNFPVSHTNVNAPYRPAALSHLNIGEGLSTDNNPPQSAHSTTGSYSSLLQTNSETILYSYVQFVGNMSITPIAGTTDQEQDRSLNSLRSSLLKRSIVGGGSMDITASLDQSTRKPRPTRHSRSSSFSAGLFSLLSPSSLLASSPKLPASRSVSRISSHRTTSSMQASQSAPALSSSHAADSGFGLGYSPNAADDLIDPETPLPTYEVQPTMLAVDLSLAPGESRSYVYTLSLPQNLPPTFRGRTFKFSYELVVGVCRASSVSSSPSIGAGASNSNSRVMKVPMRIYNNVTVGSVPSPYDLLWPVIYAQALTNIPKATVVEDISTPKNQFSLSPLSAKPGSLDAVREYARSLLVSVPDNDLSGSFDQEAGRELESGGLTGCREAVEILSRNPKKMSYDVNKDGEQVAVLTFTKPAYRLGETILFVVDLNGRGGRSRVLKLSAILETHESLPAAIVNQTSSRSLRRSHAEYHSSLVLSTLRTTVSLDIPPDASPAFQIDIGGEPGYLDPRPPPGAPGGLEWKVRLCLLVAVASESTHGGSDGVRLKSLVRDGPRGEWGSSWRGAPTIAPLEYPIQPNDVTSTGAGLKSWATYLASPFLGASSENNLDGNNPDDYDGDDPIAEDDEGWVPIKVETVECEIPIKVWPGDTAFKVVDVVFEV